MQVQDKLQQEPRTIAHPPRRSLESHGLYRLGLAYGRQVHRFRWLVIAFWVIALAVSIPFAGQVASVLQGGGYSLNSSESARVSDLLVSKLHQPASQLLVVFQSNRLPVTDAAYQQEVQRFMSQARAYQHVTGVTQSANAGKDGYTTYVTINLDLSSSQAEKQVVEFRNLLPVSPAHAYLTGSAAIASEYTHLTQHDVEIAEIAALPVALLVLLLVFGTLAAAAMPLLLALVAVPITLAIIYAIASHTSMSVFVLNIASIIGLGISIDYSLFMVRRFRDELFAGRAVPEAIGWTVATSGEAILFSGLIVMIGFSGMLLMGIPFMTSLGVGGAAVVAVSVLAALTLLPALLSVLGPRINSLRIPFLSRFTAHPEKREEAGKARRSFWQTWAQGVMRRPVLILLLVTTLLIGIGWPIFSIAVGTGGVNSLPKSAESRQGIDMLNAQFPETGQNVALVLAQSPDGSSMLTSENIARLDNLSRWIARQAHVASVVSLTQLPAIPGAPPLSEQQLAMLYSTGAYAQNPALAQLAHATTNGDTTLITVKTNTKAESSEAKALIDALRAGDASAGQGLKVLVGGSQATSQDFNGYLYGNFPRTIIFILVATYILLLLMFRSVFLPLKAILMNILSVSACYGVLVFIFQWGYLSSVLNFTANGYLDSIIPILLFCILFGLSMDYEVFLLSRIREEWLRTHDNRWAVAYGLEKTGGVITNAALLFIIVAGAFTFTSITVMKEMGLGMAVAVLVDSTIIRVLLVPATMRLLGRWNWWLPGRTLPREQGE